MSGAPEGRSLRAIFRIPLLLAALSLGGLLSALLGDGVWDGLSWLLLGIPVALIVVAIGRAA